MRTSLMRLAIGGLALTSGIGVSELRRSFRHHRVGLNENVAVLVDATSVVQIPEARHGHLLRPPNVTWQHERPAADPSEFMVTGRYSHHDFAYSLLVPAGMMAATTETWHGFGIDLANPTSVAWAKRGLPQAFLRVEGSYNSSDLASLDDAVQESLAAMKPAYGSYRMLSKRPTRLGGVPAVRFVASYIRGGESMIDDEIVAIREKEIVYTIELTTPASRYSRDRSVLTQMQMSFLADPLPDVYPLPPVYEEHK